MTPEQIQRIHRSFDAQSMMATLGARMDHIEEGMVRITAPILEGARQQQGFGHAGLTFSIGDSAAGYAALTMLPLDSEVVTAEIKINLMAPARGTLLIATGRVIKPGKRLCVVTSEVHAQAADGTQTLIALLQGTMVPVPV
ncbi:PaaI family thioesterase [uncultured Sulfitobacter sp.]|uniref:PaaI family thioesterase n=1 Tax=uncultured Sulfitobacter sp. TaxID=191468 RepID=UPI0026102248|nr:PaaI family thioesterase [uncultured Sulfitobacter sp.]